MSDLPINVQALITAHFHAACALEGIEPIDCQRGVRGTSPNSDNSGWIFSARHPDFSSPKNVFVPDSTLLFEPDLTAFIARALAAGEHTKVIESA